jgi:signal transduction histidine kinase
MQHVSVILLGMSAGIAVYTGIIHLLIGAKRRLHDWTQLSFGFLSVSIAGYTLAVLGLHTASSVADYVSILKYVFGPTSLLSIIALMWFVASYTGERPRRFLLAMTLWYTLIFALHISLPFGILYADISGLRQISLPWGEQIVIVRAVTHPWRIIVDLFFLIMFAFFFYALARHHRRDKQRARLLGAALALFLVARIVDTLLARGLIDSLYTSELAFLGIVIVMSLVLSQMITKTETELHTYQQHLEELVEARTAELTHVNAQLSKVALANLQLYRRAVSARERLTILYQSAQAISQASLDPEQIYAKIHSAIAHLMPATVVAITLIDETKHEAEDVYLADNAGRRTGRCYPLDHSFAGYMLGRDAALRIDDSAAFPPSEFTFELFGDLPDTASGVAALLRGSERIIGLVFVQSYTLSAYTEEDEKALKLLAAHAAVALENARRHQQVRALAASEERTRLARELHDAVTQTLYSASLLAEALPSIWQRNATEGAQNLGKLRQLVRGALAEMRTLLFEMRPAALVTTDLDTLLRQLGDVLTGHTRIPVEVTIAGTAHMPADVKIAIYRIAQEAFNNIAKHAGATRVNVMVFAMPGQFCLTVRDDGRGFDSSTLSGEHMGVQIMAERAAGIGARLRINSVPRQGTEVSISWPDPSA